MADPSDRLCQVNHVRLTMQTALTWPVNCAKFFAGPNFWATKKQIALLAAVFADNLKIMAQEELIKKSG